MRSTSRLAVLSIACIAIFAAASSAQIVTVNFGTPYCEDFNSNVDSSAGFTCPNTAPAINGGWVNGASDIGGLDWWPSSSTGSGGTGPSDDNEGGGLFLHTEGSGSCNTAGNTAVLRSPIFDTTGIVSPGFSCAYHMFGDEMGDLQFDLINVTQGTETLGLFTASGQMGDVWLDTGLIPVVLTAANDQWRIRVTCTMVGGGFEADMAIDTFKVTELPSNDVALASIDSPGATVIAGAAETVTVTIDNLGLTTETSIPVEYDIDGGLTIMETYVGSIAPGGSDTYSFTVPALFGPGTSTLNCRVALAGDANTGNDAAALAVFGTTLVNTFPYCEDFEADDGGYLNGGTNSSWAHGMPAGPVINAANSGVNAWVTNLTGGYNNNENSFIETPIFDCTSLTDPQLLCAIWYDTELNFDEAFVDISIDNGTTFARLGTAATGTNWYNDATNDWWEDDSNMWLNATHPMTGAAGVNGVILRFMFSSDGSVNGEDGFAVDDVKVQDPVVSTGQAPQPGLAVLDINNSTSANGNGVGSGDNGPYSTTVATGNNYGITIEGEAGQASLFLNGDLDDPGVPFPPFGNLNLGGVINLLGNGADIGFINSLFVMDALGLINLSIPAPVSLAGMTLNFQCINFTTNPAQLIAFSNAVVVNYL